MSTSSPDRFRIWFRRIMVFAAVGLGVLVIALTLRAAYAFRDRNPSHEMSLQIETRGAGALPHALRILDHVAAAGISPAESAGIGVHARSVEVPIANVNFLLAPVLGLLDRGHVRWRTLRTEVALATVGDASIACLPGEVYPELINGGMERAPGGDFDLDPVEVPHLRALLPGKVKFVFGLANDEIGYIIPKSEWDEEPPWLYGSPKRVYGEINSVGPETALILHQAMRQLVDDHARAQKP